MRDNRFFRTKHFSSTGSNAVNQNPRRIIPHIVLALCVIASLPIQPATAAFRDVQFKSIDFETSVIELHNFGDAAEPFTNWRFCSHDEDQQRRYSTPGALDSITLDAGSSIFFHFNNDAPAGATDAFNIAGLGNFATALDQDAYAIGLYVNSGFSVPAALVDHLQWSIDGVDNTTADARSVTAQQAGLWTSDTDWISTAADSRAIELLVDGLGDPPPEVHGPSSYRVVGPPLITPADFDMDGDVDGDDLATLTSAYGSNANGDIDFDGDTDGTDFLAWQQVYTGPAAIAAVAAVPEASTLALLAIGMCALVTSRR